MTYFALQQVESVPQLKLALVKSLCALDIAFHVLSEMNFLLVWKKQPVLFSRVMWRFLWFLINFESFVRIWSCSSSTCAMQAYGAEHLLLLSPTDCTALWHMFPTSHVSRECRRSLFVQSVQTCVFEKSSLSSLHVAIILKSRVHLLHLQVYVCSLRHFSADLFNAKNTALSSFSSSQLSCLNSRLSPPLSFRAWIPWICGNHSWLVIFCSSPGCVLCEAYSWWFWILVRF